MANNKKKMNPSDASYLNPEYNHKHELGVNKDGKIIPVPTPHQMMVRGARRYGVQHPGSKSIHALKSHF